MAASMSLPTVRFVGWLLAKVNRRLFSAIMVDEESVEVLRKLPAGEPVVLLPTHKSYLDFLLVSWILFTFDLKMPHIAAGSDFLNVALVASLFRRSGAFFMPRSLINDPLWAALLSEYTKVLVRNNQWVEFFIEGRRSRTGCVCVSESVCARARMCAYVHVCVCVHICVCTCVCIYIPGVFVCLCADVCGCVCVCVCVCIITQYTVLHNPVYFQWLYAVSGYSTV